MEKTRQLQIIKTDFQIVTTEAKRLGDVACRFLSLSASSVENVSGDTHIAPDSTGSFKTLGNEILWGFNRVCANQLFVAETFPFLIPVANANQIFIRCANPAPGQIVVVNYFDEI